ncbi:MAG: molybdenum cofactor guanylyltransferase MobA [Proteobacteria bacterium]|nr:molybdenum cofactor guanylyltransferase MobA [Pseudomonadota bacterium]
MSGSAEMPPCLLLAGGQSRRMGGGAKFLQVLNGKSLLERIIETIKPQSKELILNMNIEKHHVDNIGFPIISDTVTGFAGPLAGILTGLEYFNQKNEQHTHMLSLPTDAPFIPDDLVVRLLSALGPNRNEIVMAESNGRVHPVVALWPLALAEDLRHALVEEDLRKILVFADRYQRVNVVWEKEEGDPFFNINSPEDLVEAETRCRRSEAGY